MRSAAFLLFVATVIAGCAPAPPSSAPPVSGVDPVLYVENRGGPEYTVSIGGKPMVAVGCGESETLVAGQQGVPALPWDLEIVFARDGTMLVEARVNELPRWFVQFGDDIGSGGLSRVPILGPAIACPPEASPTADPPADAPSLACGGFHLKMNNDRSSAVRVAINGEPVTAVAPRSTETLVQWFLPEPQLLPWDVVITDDATGSLLFSATMAGPVDQEVTLAEEGATQAPFDLEAEGC